MTINCYTNEKYPLSEVTGKVIKCALKFINILEMDSRRLKACNLNG